MTDEEKAEQERLALEELEQQELQIQLEQPPLAGGTPQLNTLQQTTEQVETAMQKLKQMELQAVAQVLVELTDLFGKMKEEHAQALARLEATHNLILSTLEEVNGLKVEALELVEALTPPKDEGADPSEAQKPSPLTPGTPSTGLHWLKKNIL